MRFTANNLRKAMEVGSTSNWLITFQDVAGSSAPKADSINLIKSSNGNFFPAQDIDYNQVNIEEKTIEVGPAIKISVPVFMEPPTEMSITYFETHQKVIRNFMRDWVSKSSLKNKQAPSNLKKIAMKVVIWYFDKELNSLGNYPKDVYYVYPKGALSTRGDQQFAVDTNNLVLAIIGTE